MDRRPVGVFDSGLGGISVLGQMLDVLPEENFVYYGDTRNVPYGDKRPEEVLRLTHLAVDKLIAMDCKAVVIACNTATSAAAGPLRQELHMPVIGMEPALKPASLLPGDGYVVVMATQMTLTQPKFLRLMERYGQNALPVPCPGLMECVEAGVFSGPRVEGLLDRLLASVRGMPVKAVVLGCTHYPFLRGAISPLLCAGHPAHRRATSAPPASCAAGWRRRRSSPPDRAEPCRSTPPRRAGRRRTRMRCMLALWQETTEHA